MFLISLVIPLLKSYGVFDKHAMPLLKKYGVFDKHVMPLLKTYGVFAKPCDTIIEELRCF